METVEEISSWTDIVFNSKPAESDDKDYIKLALELMPEEPWDDDTWTTWTNAIKEKTGRKGKELFLPLRVFTGLTHGPEMKLLIQLIGRTKLLKDTDLNGLNALRYVPIQKKFEPIDPNNVRMYVCGPTVYDYAHVGNARPVIVFDILFRLLQKIYGSGNVTYVRNITDVDDKIIHAANDQNEDIEYLQKRQLIIFMMMRNILAL